MLIPVEVSSFALHAETKAPLIILKERAGHRVLPLFLGPMDATVESQVLTLHSDKFKTIQLAGIIIDELGATLSRVVIFHNGKGGLFAKLYILQGNNAKIIECSTNDAIGLALSRFAPLFVEESIFTTIAEPENVSDQKKLGQTLSNMDTTEFGRYYLE